MGGAFLCRFQFQFPVGRRDHLLGSGGRGVAILHDHQHPVATIQQARCHPGKQAIVPKAPIPHDRQRAFILKTGNRRIRRQAHAIAENRIAEIEGGKSRKGMTADIGPPPSKIYMMWYYHLALYPLYLSSYSYLC